MKRRRCLDFCGDVGAYRPWGESMRRVAIFLVAFLAAVAFIACCVIAGGLIR